MGFEKPSDNSWKGTIFRRNPARRVAKSRKSRGRKPLLKQWARRRKDLERHVEMVRFRVEIKASREFGS